MQCKMWMEVNSASGSWPEADCIRWLVVGRINHRRMNIESLIGVLASQDEVRVGRICQAESAVELVFLESDFAFGCKLGGNVVANRGEL